MLAPVSLVFVLCTMSVQPSHFLDREPDLTGLILKSGDICIKYSPKIFILSDDYSFYTDGDDNEAVIPYGVSVKLWCQCFGVYAAGLLMKKSGEILSTKTEDETSITWTTGKLNLQKRTKYTCAVKEAVCEGSLFISAVPAMDVMSRSNGQFSDETHTNYTVGYRNSLTVLCSGPNASGLILMKDGKLLPTEHENSSTINWFKKTPDLQISTYVCTDVDTGYNRSILIKVLPVIYGAGIVSDFDLYDRKIYNYVLTYEDTSAVYCSGPRAVKFISLTNYSNVIFTENLNETTAKLSITSLELKKSSFACVDREFADYMSIVHVTVLPRMVLTSPNIRRVNNRYVAKNDDPLEIVCSGPDAAKLDMRHYKLNIKRTEALQIINVTSIKWFINKLELRADYRISGYVCSAGEVISAVDVEVLPHPEAVDFHCISYLQYLNCTWSTLDDRNNFTLFYIENGLPVRIYEVSQSWTLSSTHRFCVWYRTDYPRYPWNVAVLSFIMQSCNSLGCSNQTFLIDHLSIVKLDSPVRLGIYKASSRHVQLSWDATDIKQAGEYLESKNGDFHYRVEYWYPGIEPLEANSSLVACYPVSCLIELTLPCSEQWYEVRVYQKLKRANEEKNWSNPASLNFYVEAKDVKMDVVDPTCTKGPRKTKDVMIYFVQKLREEVDLDTQKISKEFSSLKKKLEMMQTYLKK